jgi:hypothetical protein
VNPVRRSLLGTSVNKGKERAGVLLGSAPSHALQKGPKNLVVLSHPTDSIKTPVGYFPNSFSRHFVNGTAYAASLINMGRCDGS